MRFNLKASQQGRFSENASKFYFCQIALALDVCHGSYILHRDVKPENIVMTESGYIKLTDFGVAKIISSPPHECNSTSGTHGYMAPEIYMPRHRHSTPSDWFSLGITLHEFLTGRRPFETARLQAFRNGPVNDTLALTVIEKFQYLSQECKDFLAGLLDVKPSRRLGSRYGVEEISKHPWLFEFDWASLQNQTMKAVLVPEIHSGRERHDMKGGESQLSIQQHLASRPLEPKDEHHFKFYSFRNHPYRISASSTDNNNQQESNSFQQPGISEYDANNNKEDINVAAGIALQKRPELVKKNINWTQNPQILRSTCIPKNREGLLSARQGLVSFDYDQDYVEHKSGSREIFSPSFKSKDSKHKESSQGFGSSGNDDSQAETKNDDYHSTAYNAAKPFGRGSKHRNQLNTSYNQHPGQGQGQEDYDSDGLQGRQEATAFHRVLGGGDPNDQGQSQVQGDNSSTYRSLQVSTLQTRQYIKELGRADALNWGNRMLSSPSVVWTKSGDEKDDTIGPSSYNKKAALNAANNNACPFVSENSSPDPNEVPVDYSVKKRNLENPSSAVADAAADPKNKRLSSAKPTTGKSSPRSNKGRRPDSIQIEIEKSSPKQKSIVVPVAAEGSKTL